MKRIILLILIFSVLLTGCSKTGEKESEEYIKKRLNVPDSFVKVGYEINKDSRLAWLDYKSKNRMGVEFTSRSYFRVSDKGITYIDTENVEQPVLEFLEKNHQADFENQVKNYKWFAETVKDHAFDITYFYKNKDDVDYGDYYSVRSFELRVKSYNKGLRRIKERYENLAPDVKAFLEKEMPDFKTIRDMKYYKFYLNGDSLDWDIDLKNFGFTEKYPE